MLNHGMHLLNGLGWRRLNRSNIYALKLHPVLRLGGALVHVLTWTLFDSRGDELIDRNSLLETLVLVTILQLRGYLLMLKA